MGLKMKELIKTYGYDRLSLDLPDILEWEPKNGRVCVKQVLNKMALYLQMKSQHLSVNTRKSLQGGN